MSSSGMATLEEFRFLPVLLQIPFSAEFRNFKELPAEAGRLLPFRTTIRKMKPLVSIVDDDPAVRDSLCTLLGSAGHPIREYASATVFLNDGVDQGCLVADIRMPGMSGLELQEELTRRGAHLPVIIMTGQGDVPLAVQAMKAGAVDFIEKPFDAQRMLESVEKALRLGDRKNRQAADTKAARDLLERLTPRERQVLDHLIRGNPNKITGYELGISVRTVEIHRSHIMEKLRADSLPDVVRIVLAGN